MLSICSLKPLLLYRFHLASCLYCFFSLVLIALLLYSLAAESASSGLVTSAIAIGIGAGEFFGGDITPVLSSMIAENYGIQNIY